MDDKKTLEYIRNLILEVSSEMKSKKILAESKTPQDVFKTHEKNMKEYITENIFKILKYSEK